MDEHADPAADDLALLKLRQDVADRVDRHREADPEVAAALIAEDRGVDADHFTAEVEQRAAELPRLIAASV